MLLDLMNKRVRGSAAVFLAAAWIFAGCAAPEETEVLEKTEITLWYYWDTPDMQRKLADLVRDFNVSQEEIEVEVWYVPDEDFKKRLALSMAEGEMPDMALVDCSDFMYLHSMEPFLELTDRIEGLEAYLPVAMASCTIEGRVYGLPFGVNCPALFYNKTMLEKAGCAVPETWEEFYEAALKTTTESTGGFAINALQSEETVYSFLPILWSMGGNVPEIDSEDSAKAFTLLRRLTESGAMKSTGINLTLSDLNDQFAAGRIAMMINSPAAVEVIRRQNPELDFDVAPIPSMGKPVTVTGGEILAVAEGEHQEEAVEFLRYIADKSRMESYMDGFGFLAPRQDIMGRQFLSDPVKRRFVALWWTARPREYTAEWPEISQAISDAVRQAVVGERNQEDILAEAAAKIKSAGEERP